MTTLAFAIMKNPVLSAQVKQNERANQAPRVLRNERDTAIAALIKARRNHRKSRPLLGEVLSCVTALQAAQEREKQVVAECIKGIRARRAAAQLKAA